MTMLIKKPYSVSELSLIKRLRYTHKPAEIAIIVGRTESAINRIISIEKKKGYCVPKLRHGNLKWDKEKVSHWRGLLQKGFNYSTISITEHVHPVVISRKLAQEIHGELIH